ncbi:MAG: 5'-nucleotidase [Sulfuricurvum sp.]|nr:5'-nucleotidase [Sulfuricurvum sp.]
MASAIGINLVIGISSRALFDLEESNKIYDEKGLDAYAEFQKNHENERLEKGTAFYLVEALLRLNELGVGKIVDVIVMSRNSPDTGLRAFNSIKSYNLDITRAAFAGGASLSPYLNAFDIDLFLSKSVEDVQLAIDIGVAAAMIYNPPEGYKSNLEQIKIAFDADAVVFSEESEHIYKTQGIEAFYKHEKENAMKPLPEGPFAKLLKTLSFIQSKFGKYNSPIRLAIVTARNSPAHERVIFTLRAWGVEIDEAFFLGGLAKDKILQAYNPHIFFDDQHRHLEDSSKFVPAGQVPYKTSSPMHDIE